MERGAWQGILRSGLVATTVWSREDPLFSAHRPHRQLTFHHLQVLYYAGFKRGVFDLSTVLLYCWYRCNLRRRFLADCVFVPTRVIDMKNA